MPDLSWDLSLESSSVSSLARTLSNFSMTAGVGQNSTRCLDGWTKTYPQCTETRVNYAGRTFPRLVVKTSVPAGRTSRREKGVVLVQGKTKFRTKPIPRSGIKQKDGFDLSLTKSSFDEFSNLEKFRKQVIMPLRERNRKQHFGGNEHGKEQRAKTLLDATLEKVRTVAQRMLVNKRHYVGTSLMGFDGSAMQKDEFKVAMRSQFGIKLSKPEMDVLFNHFDNDGNGAVDFIEVKASFMNPERLVQTMESNKGHYGDLFNDAMKKIREAASAHGNLNLKAVFAEADVNNDGKISRDEFKHSLEILGAALSQRDVNVLYAFLDPNGDGEVDFGEFSWAFFNRRRNRSSQDKHRIVPWKSVTLGAAKACVSQDRIGAYCNSSAPYLTLHNRRNLEQMNSSKTEQALHGAGRTWKASNTYKVRQSIYGSDYYLNSPVSVGKFKKSKGMGLFLSTGSTKFAWSHTS